MNDIKMIGIDLDGTLLQKGNRVSMEDKEAIQACIKKGVNVHIVTGRPFCFGKSIAMSIDKRIQVVCANGGIYEIGNHIIETNIAQDSICKVIGVLKTSTACAFFKGKHEFYTHEAYDVRFLYDHMNTVFSSDLQVTSYVHMKWEEMPKKIQNIMKILIYDENEEQLSKLRKKLKCIENLTLTDYQKSGFDITSEGVHKGRAIKDVLHYYGYKRENFMAIGDAPNDLPMFEQAGLAIAMGNASDEIKAYCDVVSDSVEQNGVAKALFTYVL